jgi:hypothetical protein
LNNKRVIGCYSGKLRVLDNKNVEINFHGYGIWHLSPFEIHGVASFPFNEATKDFNDIQFDHLTGLGKNSLWGTIKAAEIIVGGSLAAAGAIIASSPTGPGAIVVGLAAAIAGAPAAVALSKDIKDFYQQSEPPPRSNKKPEPPKDLKPKQEIKPTEDNILLAVESNLRFSIINNNFISAKGSIDGDEIIGTLTTLKK